MVIETAQQQNNVADYSLKKQDIKLIISDQGDGKSTTFVAMVVDDALRNIKALRPPPYENVKDLKVEPLTDADIEIAERNNKRIKLVKGTNIQYDIDIVKLYLPNQEPKIIRIPEDHIIIPNINIYYNMSLYGIEYTPLTVPEMIQGLDDGSISNGWLGIDQAEIEASARDSMTGLVKTLMKEGSQFRKAGLRVVFIYTSFQEVDSLIKQKRDELITCKMNQKTNMIEVHSRKKGETRDDVNQYYAPPYWRFFRTGERRRLLLGQVSKAMSQGMQGI